MNDHGLPEVRSRRRTTIALVAIITIGLVFRLIHFWAVAGSMVPFRHAAVTLTDDYAYVQWAKSILAGDWLGRDTYHPYFPWMQEIAPLETWYQWWGGKEVFQQSPLYPYFLAVLFAVPGGSFITVLLVQLLIGAVQPLVMYHLARRIWDANVGLVAAFITAFYGPFIFYEGVLLRDWLLPLLGPLVLLAILWAAERDTSWRWIVTGVTLGLALLAKETAALLVPIAFCWPIVMFSGQWHRAFRAIGWTLVGFVLMLSPVLFRNVALDAPLFAFSNRAAEGIIEGWAADGYPVGMYVPPSMKEIFVQSDGRLPRVIQTTLGTFQGEWRRLVHHVALKLRGVSDPFEFPNNISFYYGVDISPILRFTLGYGIVFPLGIAGFLLSLKTWRRHGLAMAYTLAAAAGLMTTVILGRYRLELVSGLILYAAAFVGLLVGSVSKRRIGMMVVAGVVPVVVGFAQHVLLPIDTQFKDYPHLIDYEGAAAIYADKGDFGRAVAEVQRGLEKNAEHPDFAVVLTGADGTEVKYFNDVTSLLLQYHFYLAHQRLKEKMVAEAWREAEIVRETLEALPRPDVHRLYALAYLYVQLKDYKRVGGLLEEVLERDPGGPYAGDAKRVLSQLKGLEQGQP